MSNRIAVILLLLLQPVARAGELPDLDAYRGQVVLVDFWASWCVPCRRSFPWMNEMHDKYADDGLVIVAVNVDNAPQEAAAFLQDYPARFRVAYDSDQSMARDFDVQAMPSSFLIGRDGAIVGRHFGFRVGKQEEYESAIVAALEEKHP
jgi:thiol-disulfide isomerase/thioredoxin